jgi:hypothetical protein
MILSGRLKEVAGLQVSLGTPSSGATRLTELDNNIAGSRRHGAWDHVPGYVDDRAFLVGGLKGEMEAIERTRVIVRPRQLSPCRP